MVELVDTLDSKSGEHYARAGSSPARGTKYYFYEDHNKNYYFRTHRNVQTHVHGNGKS